MRQLSKMTDTVSKAIVGWERIREVLETERQVHNLRGARTAPHLKGQIEFEHVSFGYEKARPVLKDINLRIELRQVEALVSPTGARKMTTTRLIPRFYYPH